MKTIITGGAGFIGSNAASRYLRRGDRVIVVDNLSREGVQRNLDWLEGRGNLEFVQLDIRQGGELARLFAASRRRPGAPPGSPGRGYDVGDSAARRFRDQCPRHVQRS